MAEHPQDQDRAAGWWGRLARRVVRPRGDISLAVLDTLLLATAYVVVLVLRFDGAVPSNIWGRVLPWLPFAVAAGVASLWSFGLYGQVWRHASADEARLSSAHAAPCCSS